MSLQIQEPDALEQASETPAALGIDLGTTHSLVAVVDDGRARLLPLIPTLQGYKTPAETAFPADEATMNPFLMPSLVGRKNGQWMAGFRAKKLQETRPDHVITSFKRLMGKTPQQLPWLCAKNNATHPAAQKNNQPDAFSDGHHETNNPNNSNAALTSFPFPLVVGAGKGVCAQFDDICATPTELATLLLKELVAAADAALAQPLRQAVITVPAYFDERARCATRDAAKAAGLQVLRLISEPTAAALAYGLDEGTEGLWGVYDLGGGTFDFSLLSMNKGVFNVLATGGDTHLGGDDIDAALAKMLQKKSGPQAQGDPFSRNALLHLLHTARLQKEALSTPGNFDAHNSPDAADALDASALSSKKPSRTSEKTDQDLTTADVLSAAAPLVSRTVTLSENVLADAQKIPQDLKGFICVGGATRTLGLQKTLKEHWGHTPLTTLDPDAVVALGAALQAQALATPTTQGPRHLLLDVTPLSLGLEMMGGQVEKIIKRNSRIPTLAKQTLTTSAHHQKALLIHVVQGEADAVRHCRSLARFELSPLPPLPAGKARITITFQLDRDGLLTVTAQEETTGQSQNVLVKPGYDLSLDTARQLLGA